MVLGSLDTVMILLLGPPLIALSQFGKILKKLHHQPGVAPQQAIKPALGLRDSADEIGQRHISWSKRVLFLVLVFRVCLNVKALSTSLIEVLVLLKATKFEAMFEFGVLQHLPVLAQVYEAFLFLFLVTLTSTFLAAWMYGKPTGWLFATQVRNLAGFSSLWFLNFMKPKYLLGALSKVWPDFVDSWSKFLEAVQAHPVQAKEIGRALACGVLRLYQLVSILGCDALVVFMGMAVVVNKVGQLDIAGMQHMGYIGMVSELFSAVPAGNLLAIPGLHAVKLAMFSNQIVSFTDSEALEFNRLLKFLFAGKDSTFQDSEAEAMATYTGLMADRLVALPDRGWLDRLVALMTFGPDDLQKFVLKEDAEDLGPRPGGLSTRLLDA